MSDNLTPALQSLLDSVDTRLTECGREVGLVSLLPGDNAAWDNCCSASDGGGELWVRVISALPQPQSSQTCDISHLQVRVAVGAVRCMHGVDDEGFPTAAEMTADTTGMVADSLLMLQGIREWDNPAAIIPTKTIRVEQGLPLGPKGYCGGWEWTLVFSLLLDGGC